MKTVDLELMSNTIILYCNTYGFSITPLKLQKLLYYVQAWHIAKFDKNTLFGELPEAWVNGPVYKSVYHSFREKFYRNDDIVLEPKTTYEEDLKSNFDLLKLEKEQFNVINSVLKFYACLTEGNLVLKTHSDSPWIEARKNVGPFDRSTEIITVDSMYNFYGSKL